MGFQFEKNRTYMMPVQFGPCTGPRSNKDGKRFISDQLQESTLHSIIYETNKDMLQEYMLPGFTITEPYIIITHKMHRNLAWLAGHGYNVVTVDVPVKYESEKETINGLFLLAIWENHADPIITGREQLGYSKIYADIEDLHRYNNISKSSLYSWGFKFLDLSFEMEENEDNVNNIDEIDSIMFNPKSEGKMHYKYFPKTGNGFSNSDIEYVTISPKNTVDTHSKIFDKKYGTGQVKWYYPEWEDMPTQYHIVQALSKLPIIRYVGACSMLKKHNADVFNQRIVYK